MMVLIILYKIKCIIVFTVCVVVCVYTHVHTCCSSVKVRGQLLEVSFPLWPCVFQRLSWSRQVWWQTSVTHWAVSPAHISYLTLIFLILFCLFVDFCVSVFLRVGGRGAHACVFTKKRASDYMELGLQSGLSWSHGVVGRAGPLFHLPC